MSNEEFMFVIAEESERGHMSYYTLGEQIQKGNLEYAQSVLQYLLKKEPESNYAILKIELKPSVKGE